MADIVQQPATGSQNLQQAVQARAKAKRRVRLFLLLPALGIIGIFGLAPLSIALIYSFLEPGTYGGVEWSFSTDAYVQFLFERDIFDDTLGFNSAYLQIFGRSFGLAILTMCGTLMLGFPVAYFIAARPPEQRNAWLFAITLPFWTNLLIRTYSMLLIVRDEGFINLALMKLGVIGAPMQMLYTDGAVLAGLVYSYLPFMILPIYASLEKFDFALLEAGHDLYASRIQVFRHIIIPISRPGIVAGCALVLIPALGAYITPELLGGGKKLMIGNLIAMQFGSGRNWPFGSAAALILMAVVLIALLLSLRAGAEKENRHG
ncbi:Spermidine/putrescine transport system permease protein PotB [Thalassovita gelatinovora]|uniref:Spermidine/putrescine transport system permease protein PotB n=1 Tax=Thalassovita gelatinovora TaxID=53501 RepID=A0A0P1G4I4_THAGE|nr:ABC transporter permease [Thalassovita gelatinovora]QIZ82165.1 ABC transporter permease [Thalassovita gelatinovora]CUH67771.1 Spermidine/putrescine transport system permease protein PotB [Thalassovita gelatinovora]SEP67706.1 spermidine/putrescine transport system permease protein [Thalassovita gelatinovora]